MTAREYRIIVERLTGRRPPCLRCSDRDVTHCMKTGHECVKFANYSGITPNKGIRERSLFDCAKAGHKCRSIMKTTVAVMSAKCDKP